MKSSAEFSIREFCYDFLSLPAILVKNTALLPVEDYKIDHKCYKSTDCVNCIKRIFAGIGIQCI